MSTRRILVAVDFTPITSHVIEQAVRMASGMNARVYLIYVVGQDAIATWVDRFTEAVFGTSEYNELDNLKNKFAKRAEELIDKLAKDATTSAVEVSGRVARGNVVEEIVREAKILEAELLIVAAHQHTNVEHAILGSMAVKIAQHSPCSVLVVKKAGDVVST